MFNVNYLELAATVFTLICVLLAVKRSLWQFPFGLVGTALFFVVVWQQKIYANAALQIFFVGIQLYGWWYWTRGAHGARPPIRSAGAPVALGLCVAALAIAALAALALERFTDAQMPLMDAAVFALSVVAQFLLDRKRIENWPIWAVVNVLSVWLYASNGVWLFAGLYVFFFFNAFWGWWEWRRAMQQQAAPYPAGVPPA